MKPFKLFAEILITVVCLTMVYQLYEKTNHQKMTMEGSISVQNAESIEDAMDIAKTLPANREMKDRAQAEANYIMSTGDTTRYKDEIRKNGIAIDRF